MRPARRKGGKLSKSQQMARVRSKNTAPEQALRRALFACGLRYRLRLDLPGTPDLAFVRPRVAVFIDGCFWHGCPEHYTLPVANREFWQVKLARNVARDRKVDAELGALGWSVVRVWQHEVEQQLDQAVDRITSVVRTPVHARQPLAISERE